MKVTYRNPGFEHSFESIILFQTDETTPYWSDSIYYFYPQICKEELLTHDRESRMQYIKSVLEDIYKEILPEMEEKTIKYNEQFIKYEGQINDALSEAFDLNTRSIFNDLTGCICMNPVCPRFLKERYFDVFYKNSEKGALGLSLHEIIHYIWFYEWNRLFNDSYDEYETPSLKWILSEMVVESIMSDKRLSSINPYYPREHGGCVYGYFQDMIIDNRCILDTMYDLYRNNRMRDFMIASFEYCQRHEKAIRHHIGEVEKAL